MTGSWLKYGFLLILLTASITASAQWVRSGASLAVGRTNAIGHDNTGNVYAAGLMTCNTVFASDTLFNNSCGEISSPAPGTNIDLFITKHDPDGNLIWSKQVQGSVGNSIFLNSMELDGTGNVYITGQYQGDLDFADVPVISNADPTDETFLARILPDGQTDWATTIVVDDQATIAAADIALDGSFLYLTGFFNGEIQVGADMDSTGIETFFLSQFDLTGNPQWFRSLAAVDGINSPSLGKAVDAVGGDILVTAQFDQRVRFGMDTIRQLGTLTQGGLVMHFDDLGNLVWRKVTTIPQTEDILLDAANSRFFLCGFADGITAIDTDTTFAIAGQRGFLIRYDLPTDTADMALAWTFTGATAPLPSNLALNNDGSLLMAGSYGGNALISADNTLNGNGDLDGFLSKLDPDTGVEMWLQGFGGQGQDEAIQTSSLDDDHIYLGGYFSQYIRFVGDEIVNDRGTNNAFVGRVDTCPELVAEMLTMDTTLVCPGINVNLNVTNSGLNTYQWFLNDNLIPGEVNATLVASDSGTYRAEVVGLGCTKLTPLTYVGFNELPSDAVTTSDPLMQCEGGAVTLSAPLGASFTYEWFLDNAATGIADDNITVTNSGDYHVEITNQFNCTVQSDTFDIDFLPFPSDTLQPFGRFVICGGDSVTIAADTVAATIFEWYRNGELLPNDTLGVFQAKETGRYNVIASNALGCSTTSLQDTVVVQQSPIVDLNDEVLPPFLCQGDSVTFSTPLIIGQNYQWRRNGADILGANGNNLVVKETGIYSVYVTNATCDRLSDEIDMQVLARPTAQITNGNDTTICETDTRILVANAGVGLSYQWLKDGILMQDSTSQSLVVNTSGFYQVEVSNGSCSEISGITTIAVNLSPPSLITPQGATTFCNGDFVTLAASAGSNFQYQWLRDGVPVPAANTRFLEASQSGSYTVVTQNSNACTRESAPVVVDVVPIPNAAINLSAPAVTCERDSFLFQAVTDPSYEYTWLFNDFPIENATGAELYAQVQGNYSLIVNVGNCIDTSAVVFLDILPNPVPDIVRNGQFLSTSFFGLIQWYRDGQPIAGANDQNIIADQSGVYSLEGTSSTSGCSAFSEDLVVCLPIPQLSRVNDFVTVDKVGVSYQWFFEGNLIGGATNDAITAQQSGYYTVVVTDAEGCAMESDPITVCIPFPTITEDPVTGLLQADPSVAIAYQWYYDTIALPGETLNVFIPDSAGVYSVEVTDFEQCTSLSEGFSVEIVTALENELAAEIKVYPNPVEHGLFIDMDANTAEIAVTIYDQTGNSVLDTNVLSRKSQGLDISQLAPGTYWLHLKMGKKKGIWKLIKQ
ncbi:MAG: T9SS type A sorting domain-containing protein [Bacteroidota bacterium]